MSNLPPSPKIYGKRQTRKGSSEPPLFSSPLFISAKPSPKSKGKALTGAKGATVLAKTSKATHQVSLLKITPSKSSVASTPVNSRPSADTGIGQGVSGGPSTSGEGAVSGTQSGTSRSKRALAAAAASESRTGTERGGFPTQHGPLLPGDPPSTPSSAGESVVPGQGDSVRIRASVSPPVTPSASPSAIGQRMDKLEQLIFLLTEERAARASGSGPVGSWSGIAPSCPGISGSGSGNNGSGSVLAGSGSGLGLASSGSGIPCSGPGTSGSCPRNTGSGSGPAVSGSSLTGSGSGDPSSGSRPHTGAARTAGLTTSASGPELPVPVGQQHAVPVDPDDIRVDLDGSSDEELDWERPPPVLTREFLRPASAVHGQCSSSQDVDPEGDFEAQSSESALLFGGLSAVASINTRFVDEIVLPKRPGCFGSSGSGSVMRRYAPSGLVSSWNNFHLNALRGARELGAGEWSSDILPISQWHPVQGSTLPPVRRLFRPQRPLVVDPALPPPAAPSEAELDLVPVGKKLQPGSALIAEAKVLQIESRMHVTAEALDVAATLSSALTEAIGNVNNPDQLNPDPNPENVLATLEALPAALSYAANALSSALISSQVTRRDALLSRSDLPKTTVARLRLVPPSAGSLFGTHLQEVRNSTEIRTPLCVEELTRALRASAPQPKPKAAPTSGWGGQRKRSGQNRGPPPGAPPSKKGKGGTGPRAPRPKGKGKYRASN